MSADTRLAIFLASIALLLLVCAIGHGPRWVYVVLVALALIGLGMHGYKTAEQEPAPVQPIAPPPPPKPPKVKLAMARPKRIKHFSRYETAKIRNEIEQMTEARDAAR